jgi:hypothetical protein
MDKWKIKDEMKNEIKIGIFVPSFNFTLRTETQRVV